MATLVYIISRVFDEDLGSIFLVLILNIILQGWWYVVWDIFTSFQLSLLNMIVRRTYETSCIFQWFRIYTTISNCIYHISVSTCTCWIAWSFWLISCVLKLSWSWSYGSCTYNYLCNQRSSPPTLWVQIPLMARCTRWNLCDKVCQWLCCRSMVFSGFLNQ